MTELTLEQLRKELEPIRALVPLIPLMYRKLFECQLEILQLKVDLEHYAHLKEKSNEEIQHHSEPARD
jgi:hypothetical protein